jgi:hypothetical protein
MTRIRKGKTFETRKNGGSGEKQIYRGFARMSADQKQNSNCSFWSSDHRITRSPDLHQCYQRYPWQGLGFYVASLADLK